MCKPFALVPAAILLGPLGFGLLGLGLCGAVPAARAEIPATAACAAHGDVVRKLADRFGETRTGIGLHKSDAVVEVFSSAETGTWTIVVTDVAGKSCLLATGRRWVQRPAAAPHAPGEEGA